MTNELRILTVRQPYAWAIVHGGKDMENRVRDVARLARGLQWKGRSYEHGVTA